MFYLLILVFSMNVYSAKLKCGSSINKFIKGLNETASVDVIGRTDKEIVDDIIFPPSKSKLIVENGKYKNTSEESPMVFSAMQTQKNDMHISVIENKDGSKHTMHIDYKSADVNYEFNLEDLLNKSKKINNLVLLGVGSAGIVFKAEYQDNSVETLKVYFTASGGSQRGMYSDYIYENLLYAIFEGNSCIGVVKYSDKGREVQIKAESKGQEFDSKLPVFILTTVNNATVYKSLRRVMSATQKKAITSLFKRAFKDLAEHLGLSSGDDFHASTVVVDNGEIKNTQLYKQIFDELSNIELNTETKDVVTNLKNTKYMSLDIKVNFELQSGDVSGGHPLFIKLKYYDQKDVAKELSLDVLGLNVLISKGNKKIWIMDPS